MTFKIHNSHSRKELFDIISVFELPIPNRNEYNKAQIQCKMIDCLSYFDNINPDMDYFFITTKDELIHYLSGPNPHKTLTIKEKDDVMSRSKKLIGYCRNNYFLMPSSYMSFDEVYNDACHIAKHGAIPSVRKEIEGLNKRLESFEPNELACIFSCFTNVLLPCVVSA